MHKYRELPCPECGEPFDERGLGMHRKKIHKYLAFNKSPEAQSSRGPGPRAKSNAERRARQWGDFLGHNLTDSQIDALSMRRWDQSSKILNTGLLGRRYHLVLNSLVKLGLFARDEDGWEQTPEGQNVAAAIEQDFANG